MHKARIKKVIGLTMVVVVGISQNFAVHATADTDISSALTSEAPAEEASIDSSGKESSVEATQEASLHASAEDTSIEAVSEVSTADTSIETTSEASTEAATEATSEASDELSVEASSEASSTASSVDASLEASSCVSINTDLPEGIEQLPEDYQLSDRDIEMKQMVIDNDAFADFESLTEGYDYAKDEIVTCAQDIDKAEMIAEIYSGELVDFSYGVATINLSDSPLSVSEAFEYSLEDEYDLPFVEPNYITYIEDPVQELQLFTTSGIMSAGSEVPSYSGFLDRWWVDEYQDSYLNPDSDNYQWFHDMINTYYAWGVTTGDSSIRVGVIDTGVNTDHIDIDDYGSGVDFTGSSTYTDTNGHGTHVAGIIAGKLNDELGAGVAPGVQIVPLRVTTGASISNSRIISALNYAAGDGTRKVDILNLSIGTQTYSAAYASAIQNAYDAGITIVAAMGNERANDINYPAAFDHVIGVCAVNKAGELADYSSYGPWADISAPGSGMFSADYSDTGSYTYKSGTSMACPVVAGACALYMSAYGYVEPDTMEQVIKESVSGSAGENTGSGILDVSQFFEYDVTGPILNVVSSDSTEILSVASGESATLNFSEISSSDATISFAPQNYNGTESGNIKTKIVYTLDGTTPSISDGMVTNGNVYESELSVSELAQDDFEKLVIKAIAVTGMGVSSEVTTLIIIQDEVENITVEITNAPEKLVSGKSLKLEAKVLTDCEGKDISQKVRWNISSYTGNLSNARISASNGTITTEKSQTGTLTVTCTSLEGEACTSAVIMVVADNPVKKMAINFGENINLSIDYSGGTPEGGSCIIGITTLLDSAGLDLLDESNSYKKKSFQWITSNKNVVSVEGESDELTCKLKAVGAGNAVITCKALDGSGKNAKITVTVASEKKIKTLSITRTDGGSVPIKTTKGAESIELKSTQLYSDNTEGTWPPLWSTSDSNIVRIVSSGSTATIIPVARGTAIITCKALDGSGKKAAVTVNVSQLLESITVSGQIYVAEGKTATFKALSLPKNANNRSVVWSLENNPDTENITISSTGIVKVKKGADYTENDEIIVRATAKDGSNVSGTFSFRVRPLAKKVSAYIEDGYEAVIASEAKGDYMDNTLIKAYADNATEIGFKSSNTKVAIVSEVTHSDGISTAVIKAVGKGSTNITAYAQDGSGKTKTIKLTVKQLVDTITVSVQSNLALGNKATFTASALPSNANTKSVTWSLSDGTTTVNAGDTLDGLSINKYGVVSASGEAIVGNTYYAIATAKDGSGTQGSTFFSVIEKKVSSVAIVNGSEKVSVIRLFDTVIPDNSCTISNEMAVDCLVTSKAADAGADVDISWSIKNEKIATVYYDDTDGSYKVKGLKAGTTKLIVKALDGSGKKATVDVIVSTPVSGISLLPSSGVVAAPSKNPYYSYLAKRASDKVSAVIGDVYGKPSNSKVKWDYEIGFYYGGTFTSIPSEYKSDYQRRNNVFFTFSNGKVTANSESAYNKALEICTSKYGVTSTSGYPAIKVTATAKDGTDYYDEYYYMMIDAPTGLYFTHRGINDSEYTPAGSIIISGEDYIEKKYTISGSSTSRIKIVREPSGFNDYEIVSSNPDIVSAYSSGGYLTVIAHKYGSVTVTARALDGSGKKASLKITVK